MMGYSDSGLPVSQPIPEGLSTPLGAEARGTSLHALAGSAVRVRGSLVVSSCANQMYSFSYSGINQKYARQLDRVEIGMALVEFVQRPELAPHVQRVRHEVHRPDRVQLAWRLERLTQARGEPPLRCSRFVNPRPPCRNAPRVFARCRPRESTTSARFGCAHKGPLSWTWLGREVVVALWLRVLVRRRKTTYHAGKNQWMYPHLAQT